MPRLALLLLLFALQVPALLGQVSKSAADDRSSAYVNSIAAQRERIDSLLRLSDALNQTDLDSSISLATHVREEARAIGYARGESQSLDQLGFFMDRKANYRAGIHYYRQSMAVKAANQDSSICWTLSEIGYCLNALGRPDSAQIVFREAMEIARRFDRLGDVAINHVRLSYVALGQHDMNTAITSLREALAIGQEQEDWFILGEAHATLSQLYLRIDELDKARVHAQGTLHAGIKGMDDRQVATGQMQVGLIHQRQGRSDSALFQYRRAIATARHIEDVPRIAYGLQRCAELLMELDSAEVAVPLMQEALAIARSGGLLSAQAKPLLTLTELALEECKTGSAKVMALEADRIAKALGNPSLIQQTQGLLSRIEANRGNQVQALAHLQSSITYEREANDDAFAQNLLRHDMEHAFRMQQLSDSLVFARERAEAEVALTKERANTNRQRTALMTSVLVLALLGGLAVAIYRGKQASDRLLLNILPRETAQELKTKGRVQALMHPQVTVLFTDFVGFTALSAEWPVEELVAEIDACFRAFDAIMESYQVEKIKTIGDAYMAVGGLDGDGKGAAVRVLHAALAMQEWMLERQAQRKSMGLQAFQMRAGVHTGPVASGVVGTHKFQYDIWGDTVNVSSRVENAGEAGRVNVSQATVQLVGDAFVWEDRGELAIKGKGTLAMSFLGGLAPAKS